MDVEKKEIKDWENIRQTLNQQYKYDADWEKSIEIFNNRIRRKFFDPIQYLIDQNSIKGEGFTIVTVQCALIEMFAAFKTGKIFNHSKKLNSPNYEYKRSIDIFTSLLHSDLIFEDQFWELDLNGNKVIDKPFIAADFYKDVRCGLVHEARTKGKWFINAVKLNNGSSVKTEKIFLKKEQNGDIRIYRTILHYRLLVLLDQYCNDLRDQTAQGETLRRFFTV